MRSLLLLGLVLLVAACQPGRRLTDDGAPPVASPSGGAVAPQQPVAYRPGDPGVVSLTDADLAPVDAWLDHRRNSQWILGDEVEIVASREYFAAALTVSSTTSGIVQRTDDVTPNGTIVTLRFRGAKSQAGVMTSPRVQIGTGLTVTARKLLRLHLLRTTDPATPVHVQVTARGEAARGVHEAVSERAETIAIGGTLRRRGGGYAWDVVGRR
jgi:hypothetical protein